MLGPRKTLLDATSGNTGIAYAMLAAPRGIHVRLCVPANITPERTRLLAAYGADLVLTDPMEGSDGAIREARRLYERDPDAYFYPDQYGNDANWRAHFDSTAPELIEQTGGRITHFVAGLGTSGTFTGTARRLRHWRPATRLISVQPDSPLHGVEGLKHMASAIVPAIYDPALADDALEIATEDAHALDAPACARGRTVRRPLQRRGAGRMSRGRSHARSWRDRHHLSRRRRSVSQRAVLVGAAALAVARDGVGDPRACRRGLSARVLWRAHRARWRRHAGAAPRQHFRRRAESGDSSSARRTISAPKRPPISPTRSCSASITLIPIIRRCRQRSICSTHGRI